MEATMATLNVKGLPATKRYSDARPAYVSLSSRHRSFGLPRTFARPPS